MKLTKPRFGGVSTKLTNPRVCVCSGETHKRTHKKKSFLAGEQGAKMEPRAAPGCAREATVKDMRLSLIGVGKLGLCAALAFERKGCSVLGCDVNGVLVEQINGKTLNSYEPHVMEYLRDSQNFRATTSLEEAVNFADIIFIFVDTPNGGGIGQDAMYDHSKLSEVLFRLNALGREVMANKHVVINSTVMPGYIATVARHLLLGNYTSTTHSNNDDDDGGSTATQRSLASPTLSYNPYFVAQGDILAGFFHPELLLIGEGSPVVGDMLENLYRSVCETPPIIRRMTPEAAEITKLAVNCYITLKISFANLIGNY